MSRAQVRRLTPAGIDKFRLLLSSARAGQWPDFANLASDNELTTPATAKADVEVPPSSRDLLEVGLQLQAALRPLELAGDLTQDVGLWSWLSLHWMDASAKVRMDYRYIPEVGFKTYYRHVLLTPYRICRALGGSADEARAVLSGTVDAPGELFEQLAAYQVIASSRSLLGTATSLYVDAHSGRPKPGSAAKAPGSARRFVDMIMMFSTTWDLQSMTVDQIKDLLPPEFDRFK